MKKNIRQIIGSFFILSMLPGCSKILNKKPLNIITDAQVWSDPNLINAYVVNLYSRSHMTGIFGEMDVTNDFPCNEIANSDEGRINYDFEPGLFILNFGLLNSSGGMMDYWDYTLIRDINTFLVEIKTASADDATKKQLTGQVRFLRAYTYFELVKRYGGVPLILVPQSLDGGDSLYVKRNTEKELYDFIGTECDTSATMLPDSYSSDQLGRATKFAALALKSRAMLYAASEAEYGTLQLNGLVGMPATDATPDWQASYDASKAIIDANQFVLYNQYADKAQNYQMIFLDKGNSEEIFAKKYISIQAGHRADDYYETNANYSYWGTAYSPTLEMVNAYENIDGTPGNIDWPNVTGDLRDFFKNKDPRLNASILYNGLPWVKDTVRIWLGIYSGGVLYNSETAQLNGMNQVGRDQQTTQGPKTGFQMKKFLNPNLQFPGPDQSDQDWIIFRYAETLLNYAEAAFELGKPAEALSAVNQIRARAGIAALTSINMNEIRHERQIELAFETHRFWDLRRWRMASGVLNAQFTGLFPYYDADHQRFFYKVGNCESSPRIFKDAYYYLPITTTLIDNNPNLVQNPEY
jgi:starch-binding outer membrane protein, SusD/RagB family